MGLLEGLPAMGKKRIKNLILDSAKVVIDQIERKSLNDDFLDVYDTVYIPICRRLYRRVGPRFDIKMMDKLFEELSNNFNTKEDIESERNEKLKL